MTSVRGFQRGAGLIEAMIALLVLSFGLLGLAGFQANMIAGATDSQTRLSAAALADELLAYVRVAPDAAGCYQFPQPGACANDEALAQTQEWAERATQLGFGTVTASSPAAGQFRVRLGWTSKTAKDTRALEVTTDVRP